MLELSVSTRFLSATSPKINSARYLRRHLVMAHQIEKRDRQAGTGMACHGLTIVVPEVTREIAFPFEINRKPIYVNTGKLQKVSGFEVFIADDDNLICGRPMAESYVALTNSQFWATCSEALQGTGAIVESAGTLMDRTRRFMTIKLPDDATTIGGRKFLSRISLLDSIDGTLRFHAVNSSTCVVCANTARMVLGDHSGEFHFQLKHTSGFISKIEGMENVIEGMIGVQAHFNAALAIAANEPLSVDNARPLFAGWIGEKAKGGLSTRAVNTVDRLVALHRGGAGNKGETLLDGISAATDFYSHESSGGDDREKQALSSELGAGATAKTRFINALFLTSKGRVLDVDRDGIKTMQSHGARLLADYAAAN